VKWTNTQLNKVEASDPSVKSEHSSPPKLQKINHKIREAKEGINVAHERIPCWAEKRSYTYYTCTRKHVI
jgi:hypothetical protein